VELKPKGRTYRKANKHLMDQARIHNKYGLYLWKARQELKFHAAFSTHIQILSGGKLSKLVSFQVSSAPPGKGCDNTLEEMMNALCHVSLSIITVFLP
jgi:hypothetical protein